MTPRELDQAYFALCQAMRGLDVEEATKYLACVGLLLISESDDLAVVLKTIEDAKAAASEGAPGGAAPAG